MNRYAVKFLAILAGFSPNFAAAQDQTVPLPHVFRDDMGSTWDIQYDGSVGDGGNDLYDGGGRLIINNSMQYQSPTQQATLDAARNELCFPQTQMGALNVSRRVAVLPNLNTVRFTEILENPTGAAMKIPIRAYFNMGGSVQQSIPLVDEKHPRSPVGYAIGDQNNAVAMIAGGRSSKVPSRFDQRTNDDNIFINWEVDIPAHQTAVLVHFQLRRPSASAAADAWKEVKEKDLLRNMPRELRKRMVNFPVGDGFAGDMEILRGDTLDIVEMRGGDTYRGFLKIDRFRLQTLYGPITLPIEKVACLINIGRYRPSQLVITTEGDVFGGRLDIENIKLQLTSGQFTTIPLAQITRLGYRKRPGEPEEADFETKAAAYLRGGERIRVKLPSSDFNLATTSGPIRLSPKVISSIVFQDVDNNVPEVHLIDGTRISALLGASTFDMTLAGLGADQPARLPAAALLKFNFAPEQETDYLTPRFILANQDELIGTVGGTLSLETPFDTLHVEGPEIKRIIHTKTGDHDVQITLWDDSTLSGRLVESHITCQLKCGVNLRIPISLINTYDQPLPYPSAAMIEKIKQIVHDLDSDNWKIRDAAQTKILAIGPCAMSVLKQVRPTAPAEAAQRIDVLLGRLSTQLESATNPQSPNPAENGAFDDNAQRWGKLRFNRL